MSDDNLTRPAHAEQIWDLMREVGDAGLGVPFLAIAKRILRLWFPNGTERLLEALGEQIEDAVLLKIPEIEQRVKALEGTPADKILYALATFEDFQRIYFKTADPQKREVLRNALVNAFSTTAYQKGLTRRLIRLVDELDYGDIHTLRLIGQGLQSHVKPWSGHGSLIADHADRLLARRIIRSEGHPKDYIATHEARVTELGRHLISFIADAP